MRFTRAGVAHGHQFPIRPLQQDDGRDHLAPLEGAPEELELETRLALDIEDAVFRVRDIDGDGEFVVRGDGFLGQRRDFDLVGEGADDGVIELELHLAGAPLGRDLEREFLEQLVVLVKLDVERGALGAIGADDGGELALPAGDDPARGIDADDADIGDFLPGIRAARGRTE